MSNVQNEEWLENARLNFKESLDLDTGEGYKQAQSVVDDVRQISKDEAERMQEELDEAKQFYDNAMRQSDDDESRGDDMRLEVDRG